MNCNNKDDQIKQTENFPAQWNKKFKKYMDLKD